MSRFRSSAASAALAAALVGVALGARGGTQLQRTTVVELLLLAVGAATIVAALLLAQRGGRLDGAWAIASFGALAALTALSVGWSIAPDLSYVETGRTLAYLAVFTGAVAAARLAPGAAPILVRGLLIAAVAIAAYGLASRVWPGAFGEGALTGRIALPYDYWNALAGAAAMGIVPALWLGSRRTGTPVARALAYPATGVLVATVLIAQSRGALIGAVAACALWIAIVPLRLRSLVLLAVAAVGAAPVSAWALSKDPFKVAALPVSAREAVAGDFGLLLLATVFALLAAGLAIAMLQARHPVSLRVRARSGIAVAVVAAAVPLALLTSVASSDRGLGGTISDRVDQLTSETSAPPSGGARLSSVSSSRASYWRQAWHAFEERPLEGLGANSFELSRLRYRKDGFHIGHAHGFIPQTLADLGLVGLLASLALLATWLAAAARSTGLGTRRGDSRPPWTSERAALVALALAVVAYGVQAFADWTWFVPGITVTALVAAGFVAGRGPLGRPSVGMPSRGQASPPRIAAAGAVVLLALLCGWTAWQPVASARAVARSYESIDAGDTAAALREADRARDHDPYSNEPLYARATALGEAGHEAAAMRTLRQAVVEHPRDPEAWLHIAAFALYTLDEPKRTLELLGRAAPLDPNSQSLATIRDRAAELIRSSRRHVP